MKALLWYGALCLSFMLVITAQWYDRNQLQAAIERLKPAQIWADYQKQLDDMIIIDSINRPELVEKVVPQIEISEVIKEMPVEVVKEIEVIKEVEKVVEVPARLRDFPDIQTARAWLEAHKSVVLIAPASGIIDLVYPSGGSYDCEDYALELQRTAAKDGWNIWPVAVTNGYVWNIQVRGTSEANPYHVGNMFRVNGTFYYVESSPPNQGYIVPLLKED